jgi:hypothetical protein
VLAQPPFGFREGSLGCVGVERAGCVACLLEIFFDLVRERLVDAKTTDRLGVRRTKAKTVGGPPSFELALCLCRSLRL